MSSELAVEVPIWLAPETIAELKRGHGIALMPEGGTGALTGHIDFLQVRNRAVHILDYKPDARTNRPIAQLTVYALALTKLVPGLIRRCDDRPTSRYSAVGWRGGVRRFLRTSRQVRRQFC